LSRLKVAAALAIAIGWAACAHAQLADPENQSDPDDPAAAVLAEPEAPTRAPGESTPGGTMDEITVIAGPQVQSAFELEMERQAKLKEAVFAGMQFREKAEEETAWRQADRDLQNPESRIKWGYNPQAEQRMGRDYDALNDLPIDQTKPATLFRAEF
jgi:hypothetical protein